MSSSSSGNPAAVVVATTLLRVCYLLLGVVLAIPVAVSFVKLRRSFASEGPTEDLPASTSSHHPRQWQQLPPSPLTPLDGTRPRSAGQTRLHPARHLPQPVDGWPLLDVADYGADPTGSRPYSVAC